MVVACCLALFGKGLQHHPLHTLMSAAQTAQIREAVQCL